MFIRSAASTPDLITPPLIRNASTGPLQRLIDAVKAVWNAILRTIQSLFSCCRNAEAEEVSNSETGEGELIFLTPCSSEEETRESQISTSSSPYAPLHQLTTKEEWLQLLKTYEEWLRLQQSITVGDLLPIARSDQGIKGRFASVTVNILMGFPYLFTPFRLLMISNETRPQLAGDFATAFETKDITPLMRTVESMTTAMRY